MGRERRLDALEERLGSLGELIAEHDRTEDLARFAKYAEDPVGFIQHELGGEPWDKQADIATLVQDHGYVTVQSCNGAGKDWLASRLALWWVYCRKGFVLMTGPTERQAREVCMGELRRAFAKAPQLPGQLFETALRVDRAEQAGVLTFTSNDVSKLSGFHAPRLMVIVTEAQGIPAEAWEGLLANVTGQSRVVALGNPLTTACRFYEFTRSETWESVTISAADHPNIQQGREVIPGSITLEWVEMMAREFGQGSGVWRARVEGEFPDSAEDTLCSRSWIDVAHLAWESGAFESVAQASPVLFALDVARFGADESVLVIRQGPILREILTWHGKSTTETAGRVLHELTERNLDKRLTQVVVDEAGLGGGVVDALKEQDVAVIPFNGGRSSRQPERFANLRAEAFWTLRRLLEERDIALPKDDRLTDELTAMQWVLDSRGHIAIESKDALKGRLGRSPDRSDAVSMAFALIVPRAPVSVSPGNLGGGGILSRLGSDGTEHSGGLGPGHKLGRYPHEPRP